MKHRSEFFDVYKAFRALVKTQHSAVIKCFRCDMGGEYTSNKFCELLALDGTIHQTSCTDTPEQNGVAERKHRHIVETARSLMLSSSVPSEFWGEAVLTAVRLIKTIHLLTLHVQVCLLLKNCMAFLLIIHSLESLVVCVSFFVLI